jgi:hypothetical protein
MNQIRAREMKSMASKLNMMSFLQQLKGLAAITQRCPQTRRPWRLVLPSLSSSAAARRRLTISIAVPNLQNNPYPVSITHVKAPAPPPSLPG